VVRVFSLTNILAVSYPSAARKLRRPFLSNRYFFITVRLLQRRTGRFAAGLAPRMRQEELTPQRLIVMAA